MSQQDSPFFGRRNAPNTTPIDFDELVSGHGEWEHVPNVVRNAILHLMQASVPSDFYLNPADGAAGTANGPAPASSNDLGSLQDALLLKQRVTKLEQDIASKVESSDACTTEQLKNVTVKLLRAIHSSAPSTDTTMHVQQLGEQIQAMQEELAQLRHGQEEVVRTVTNRATTEEWSSSAQSLEMRLTMMRNNIRRQEGTLSEIQQEVGAIKRSILSATSSDLQIVGQRYTAELSEADHRLLQQLSSQVNQLSQQKADNSIIDQKLHETQTTLEDTLAQLALVKDTASREWAKVESFVVAQVTKVRDDMFATIKGLPTRKDTEELIAANSKRSTATAQLKRVLEQTSASDLGATDERLTAMLVDRITRDEFVTELIKKVDRSDLAEMLKKKATVTSVNDLRSSFDRLEIAIQELTRRDEQAPVPMSQALNVAEPSVPKRQTTGSQAWPCLRCSGVGCPLCRSGTPVQQALGTTQMALTQAISGARATPPAENLPLDALEMERRKLLETFVAPLGPLHDISSTLMMSILTNAENDFMGRIQREYDNVAKQTKSKHHTDQGITPEGLTTMMFALGLPISSFERDLLLSHTPPTEGDLPFKACMDVCLVFQLFLRLFVWWQQHQEDDAWSKSEIVSAFHSLEVTVAKTVIDRIWNTPDSTIAPSFKAIAALLISALRSKT